MEAVFLKVFNMSLNASWLIAAVLLLRLLLHKAPKWTRGILWAVVAFRLACPFSLESVFSLLPAAQTVHEDILYTPVPAIDSGIPLINQIVNPVLSQSFAPEPGASVNPLQVVAIIAANLWVLGMLGMLLYTLICYLRLRKQVRVSICLRENIWICDDIQSPFLLGLVAPKIFLPSCMEQEQRDYVLAHEQAHIRRWDHWWKPLGFAVLTLHWFNPLVWFAYSLLCRDIELACDEKVIKQFRLEDRKAYSHALLCCSTSRKWITACPLAFGEVSVKKRIQRVLSYKKPAFWIVLITLIVSVALVVCFLTDPVEPKKPERPGEISAQTESDGVTFTCLERIWAGDKLLVRAELYNGRKLPIHLAASVFLYRDDVRITLEDMAWDSGMQILEPGGKAEILVDLTQYDCDQPGNYRLEKEYFVDGGDKAMKVTTELSLREENTADSKKPTLTLEDVIRLSKQKVLTPEDFAGYQYRQIGSGLDIWQLEIDGLFTLRFNNMGMDVPLEGVFMEVRDGTDEIINICTDNVKAYIKKHKDNPVVPELLRGYVRLPVGDSPKIMEKMQQLGATWAEPGPQEVLPFYPVQSVEDLQRFREEVEPLFDYSQCPEGYYTFADMITYDGYDESFFATKEAVFMYYSGRTGQDAPEVRYARQYDGNQLRICVSAPEKDFIKETMGWLLCVELDKGTLRSSESAKVLIEVYPYGEGK